MVHRCIEKLLYQSPKRMFFLDGDRCWSNPDELHPSFEHRGCAAHHNSLPQHACVGRRSLPASFWQGCELQGLDRREDSGWRPPGAADTKRRLLGMLISYRYSEANTSQCIWLWTLDEDGCVRWEEWEDWIHRYSCQWCIQHLRHGYLQWPPFKHAFVYLTFRLETATGTRPTSSSRPRTQTYSP